MKKKILISAANGVVMETLVKSLTGLVNRGKFEELDVLKAVLNKIKEDNIKL